MKPGYVYIKYAVQYQMLSINVETDPGGMMNFIRPTVASLFEEMSWPVVSNQRLLVSQKMKKIAYSLRHSLTLL